MKKRISSRWTLAEAQNWRCCYCGGRMSWHSPGPWLTTREHVTPRALRGSDDWSNLVAACHACNVLRGRLIDAEVFLTFREECRDRGLWPPVSEPTERVVFMARVLILKLRRARRLVREEAGRERRLRLNKARAQAARAEREAF